MAKVKFFGLGTRRPDISAEDFQDHWRHPHGTWGRKMLNLRGYVQSHPIHSELLGTDQTRFDCVAEMWLDNERAVGEFHDDPVFAKYLLEDEPTFCDLPKATFLATREEVLTAGPEDCETLRPGDEMWSHLDRPYTVKLLHFVGGGSERSWVGEDDCALGRKLGALRHVRCHPLAMHGDAPPFLGIHELWWPTVKAFRAGMSAAPDCLRTLQGARKGSITMLAQAERYL
jgi:hypothetical protein